MTTNALHFFHEIRSPLRKRLLAYFFSNPQARLYLREIALKLEVDAANLSRELKRLEKEGIFLSKKNGLQKYFSLNKNYPLYRELKSMIFKTLGVQGAIQSLLNGMPGIQRAFLYGSFAKETEGAHSDIDVCLVIQRQKFDEESLLLKLHKLENNLGREINYTFFTVEEWEDKKKSDDNFITQLLQGKRIDLIHEKVGKDKEDI